MMMPRRGAGRVDDDPVEAVGPGSSQGGVELDVEEPRFLDQGGSGQRMLRPSGGVQVGGRDDGQGRSGSTRTEAEVSTVSARALKATQQPE